MGVWPVQKGAPIDLGEGAMLSNHNIAARIAIEWFYTVEQVEMVVDAARGSESVTRKALEITKGFSDNHIALACMWARFDAFSDAPIHPSASAMEHFGATADFEDLRLFWTGYLAIRVLDLSNEYARNDPRQLVEWTKERIPALLGRLDALDRRLSDHGKTLYLAYDHLDRIGNPKVRVRYAAALLGLWVSLTDRYQRLRAKIFIQDDLLDRAQALVTDVTKLKGRSVELRSLTDESENK